MKNKLNYLAIVQHDVQHDSLIAETDNLSELLDILEDDVETYNVDKVKYLIYVGTDEDMEEESFFESTDYYVEYEKLDDFYKVSGKFFNEAVN